MSIRMQIASVPDREHLVAELWVDDVQIAEVSREDDRFSVEVYATRVSVPLDEYLVALARAREELTN